MADDVSNTPLITFYRGQSPDAAGRRIDQIWHWDFRRLEMAHDYVQWLFPLPEPSRFNPEAPRLTAAAARLFQIDDDLQARLRRSLDVMLLFYGLTRDVQSIVRGSDFAERSAGWLTPLNHNHLRLTRILLSLGYLGRKADAEALFACLADIARHEGREAISERTAEFWRSAIEAPPPLR
jgi:hypothetical protein